MGRIKILVADGFRHLPHGSVQLFGSIGRCLDIPGFLRLHQPQIILLGKFGIQRQPNQPLRSPVTTGQLEGELYPLTTTGNGFDVAIVLPRGQNLFQQAAQLDLTKGAACLDIDQYLFKITDPICQTLHLAQPLLNLLQPLANQLERIPQALLQRFVQLFINRGTHLLQLAGIILLNHQQAGLHGLTQLIHPAFVADSHGLELTSKNIQLILLQTGDLTHPLE